MIHAYIGDGKGKTTAAMGLAMRAAGAKLRVKVIFFDKGGESYAYAERESLRSLGIPVVVTGCDRRLANGAFRYENNDADKAEARRGLNEANETLRTQAVDLLVLDEMVTVCTSGNLPPDDLAKFLKNVPSEVEVVITGRCSDEKLLDDCHLITRMTKVRHYFDHGTPSRLGIEF